MIHRILCLLIGCAFISACDLDIESDTQLLNGTKLDMLEKTNTLYNASSDGLDYQHLKLATASEKSGLPDFPIYMTEAAQLRKVLDCYVYEPMDGSDKLYVKFSKIKGSIYLMGYSEDGCLKKGKAGKHYYGAFIVTEKGISLPLTATQEFDVWTTTLSDLDKFLLGVQSEITFEKDANGDVREVINVTKNSAKALKEYFKRSEFSGTDETSAFTIDTINAELKSASNMNELKFCWLCVNGNTPEQHKLKTLAATLKTRLAEAKAKEEADRAAQAKLAQMQKTLDAQKQKQIAQAKAKQYNPAPSAPASSSYSATPSFSSSSMSLYEQYTPGDVYFLQGVLKDEPVVVVMVNEQRNMIKVRRTEDGTSKWVSPSDLISRESKNTNNVARGAIATGLIICALGGCQDQN